MSSRFLHFFDQTPEGRKTKIVVVRSVSTGEPLGLIKWFGRWRQYAFFPNAKTVWNPECLEAINNEIRTLALKRKGEKDAD